MSVIVSAIAASAACPRVHSLCVRSLVAICGMLWLSLAAAFADSPEPEAAPSEPPLEQSDFEYWAYRPVVRPPVPQLDEDHWSLNPIDRFVLAKLLEKELAPAEAASWGTLLRRVSWILTGLPPSLSEQQEFLERDDPAVTYPVLVERFLTKPAYGERWAQQWLDLVRFAETDGFEHDLVRPEAWRYRDWVIRAFQQNMPYDEFLRFQIAGDELHPDSSDARIATGYLLAGPDMPDLNSQVERRHQFLNGMTANLGEVVLGLQLGCAECHHHKIDPISQHDFYRLRAFFETIELFPEKPKSEAAPEQDAPSSALPARRYPTERVVWNRAGASPVSRLWIRGDFRRPGPELLPDFPRVLNPHREAVGDVAPVSAGGEQRRSQLAGWLTSRNNPLTARVMVNRLWQQIFGTGLVYTASDWGWMGEPVTHPELLDWLAAELMDSGWDLQHLQRLMLTSATFQQASAPSGAAGIEQWNTRLQLDPANRWLSRMNRRRLDGESLRDSLLAVSEELNLQPGGPGVRPPLPAEVAATLLKGQWEVTKAPQEHQRRSIYLFARRNLRYPLLEVFDRPDSSISCARRNQSTTAPQALHLLNSEFVRGRSAALSRLIASRSTDQRSGIRLVYQTLFCRTPSEPELRAAEEFLATAAPAENGWPELCHALINLNEMLYLD